MFFENEWEPWVMVLYLFNVLTSTCNDLQLAHTMALTKSIQMK